MAATAAPPSFATADPVELAAVPEPEVLLATALPAAAFVGAAVGGEAFEPPLRRLDARLDALRGTGTDRSAAAAEASPSSLGARGSWASSSSAPSPSSHVARGSGASSSSGPTSPSGRADLGGAEAVAKGPRGQQLWALLKVQCPCGHILPKTAKFCGKCGKTREEALPMDSIAAKVREPWVVSVDRASGEKLGMSINKSKLRIESITPGGLIDAWNLQNSEWALHPGYRIIEVNGELGATEIFSECMKLQSLEILVEEGKEIEKRAIPPSGVLEVEKLRTQHLEQVGMEKTVEVNEMQTLIIGPFEAGVACEFVEASYGWEDKCVDVTEKIRELWAKQHTTGLRISQSKYNSVLGHDPARLRIKKLKVTYRLHNVRNWDVSQARYAEGVGKLQLVLPLMTKAVTNVVGLTLAASGYGLGRVETAMKRTWANFTKDENDEATDPSMADSEMFQWGFSAWLYANGIFPQIQYEEISQMAGSLLRQELFPDEDPPGDPSPPQDIRQTPILVANHVCYIDGPILAATLGAPRVLAKAGTLDMPILGTFGAEIGVIEVDRDSADSRRAVVNAINKTVDEWRPGLRPLLLFPEGTTSNGDDLLPFNKGAFIPAKPVRPIVIYYTGNWHPANVNFKTSTNGEIEPTSDSEWYEQFLGHMLHSLQIKVLPPYVPNVVERADPGIFMNNVREVMRKAYLELKEECESDRKKKEEETYVGLARRTLIDTPLDFGSKLLRGASAMVMGESENEEVEQRQSRHDRHHQRSASERAERRSRRRSERERKDSM